MNALNVIGTALNLVFFCSGSCRYFSYIGRRRKDKRNTDFILHLLRNMFRTEYFLNLHEVTNVFIGSNCNYPD